MTVLITGANGVVSTALLEALRDVPGVKPRALVRDPAKATGLGGVEVAVGDLEDPGSLAEPFAGVDTLWLLTPVGPQAPHASMNAVWAARQAGVRHIVRMSAIGAAHDAPTRNGRLHALSDAEIRGSGLGWTIIKPHYFMQNLAGSVQGGTLYNFLGEGRLGMIDVRDIAEFAARIIADPQAHTGRTYTPTGPSSISMHEVAAALEPLYGTEVTYQPVKPEDTVPGMIDAGLTRWVAETYAEYGTAYSRGWGDFTTRDFTEVVGRPARSFTAFAQDNAPALRAA